MERLATSAPPLAAAPPVAPSARPGARTLLIGIALAEVAFLAAGFAVGRPFAAVALAAGFAFFLVAFRSPGVAWLLVWAALPFSMEVMLPGGAAIYAPTEPMIALSLAGWALRSLKTGVWTLRSSPLHAPLGALAAVAMLSILFSRYPAIGLKAWLVVAGYVAFGYLYFVNAACDPVRRERWVRLTMAAGALCGLYGTIRVLMAGVRLGAAYGAARPFFAEHGSYAAYLSMLLPLAILLALERKGRERIAYGGAAFLMGAGILLSFTRAAWLSLIVVLPIMLTTWARWRRSWRPVAWPAAVALAIVVVLAGLGASDRLARHAESSVERENTSNLERLNRWIAAIEMARARPLLGVGYGAYPASYPAYRRKMIVTDQSYISMGVHNDPLRLLSEMGIVGLAAGLWFLIALGRAGSRAIRASSSLDTRVLAVGLLAGLATYAVHGLFNSYLGMDKVTLPIWMGIGGIAALEASASRGGREVSAR